MDYSFAPEHDAFRGEVREFIQRELPPRIAAGEDAYSDENFDDAMTFRRKLGAKRWIGIGWPTQYGGLGATPMMQAIFHEEMIYLNAPLDPQAYQVGPAIIDFGGRTSRRSSYLPPPTRRSCGVRASPSPTPAPTSPGSRPPQPPTATTT